MVSYQESLAVIEHVYKAMFPETHTQPYPELFEAAHQRIFISHNGLLTIATEEKIIAGFGILHKLTPTTEMLSAIATWNQQNRVGHYWLAEGSDNNHWSLLCGFKHLPSWESGATLLAKLRDIAAAYDALLDGSLARAKGFGGEVYWNPEQGTNFAQCLVLLSHLA